MRQVSWILLAICLGLSLMASRCNDGCEPEEMRCHDDRVEICNAGKNWETVVDCLELEDGQDGPGFVCVEAADDTEEQGTEPTCEEVTE